MKYEIHINLSRVIEADSEEQAMRIAKEFVRDNAAAYVEVDQLDEYEEGGCSPSRNGGEGD